MYAVIRTGGKQLRVEPGQAVRVEKLEGAVGDSVSFGEVLLVAGDDAVAVGRPLVEGAVVTGTITEQGRGPKIRTFKMKRRTGYRRKYGHRQAYTEVRVEKIAAAAGGTLAMATRKGVVVPSRGRGVKIFPEITFPDHF